MPKMVVKIHAYLKDEKTLVFRNVGFWKLVNLFHLNWILLKKTVFE